MSNIEHFASGQPLAARDSRRLNRSVTGLQISRRLRGTQIDTETDVALDKLDNVTITTGAAMAAVVKVAQAQQAMELLVPAASGRLALLADGHALDMADTVSDLRHRVRRI